MRTKSYRRRQRERHIKRKENILRKYRLDNPPHKYNDKDLFCATFPRGKETRYEGDWLPYWYVDHRGKLNKGKIHCSCGMCSTKTRNKTRRYVCRNYAPSINYKPCDLRKIQKMDLEEYEWKINDI